MKLRGKFLVLFYAKYLIPPTIKVLGGYKNHPLLSATKAIKLFCYTAKKHQEHLKGS